MLMIIICEHFKHWIMFILFFYSHIFCVVYVKPYVIWKYFVFKFLKKKHDQNFINFTNALLSIN